MLEDVEEVETQKKIAEKYHLGKTNHREIEETENRIKMKYYGPICQQAKYNRHPTNVNINVTPTPNSRLMVLEINSPTPTEIANKLII